MAMYRSKNNQLQIIVYTKWVYRIEIIGLSLEMNTEKLIEKKLKKRSLSGA